MVLQGECTTYESSGWSSLRGSAVCVQETKASKAYLSIWKTSFSPSSSVEAEGHIYDGALT